MNANQRDTERGSVNIGLIGNFRAGMLNSANQRVSQNGQKTHGDQEESDDIATGVAVLRWLLPPQ